MTIFLIKTSGVPAFWSDSQRIAPMLADGLPGPVGGTAAGIGNSTVYGKLESLRGVAACLVVLYHSPFLWGAKPLALFAHGYLFVDFFFILSGFVMSHAYHAKIVQGLSFSKYLVLRLARIYPLHLCVLLAWVPYVLLKQQLAARGLGSSEELDHSNWATFLSNLLLVHSLGLHHYLSWNGPSWSISAEFVAYLVFYLVSATIDRTEHWYVPTAISAAAYAFLISLHRPDFDITYDYGAVRCLAGFYLGVALYRLRREPPCSFVVLTVLELTVCLATAGCVAANNSEPFTLICTMLSFAATIFIFSSTQHGLVGRMLEWKIVRWIGEWSYSIYMVHALIIAVSYNVLVRLVDQDWHGALGWQAVGWNSLLLAVTIGVSRFTFAWIERPCRDLGRTWAARVGSCFAGESSAR